MRHALLAAFALGFAASAAQAAPVNLNTWTAESYPPVSGFNGANWQVNGTGDTVQQTVNGQPTVFYADTNAFGTQVTGKAQVVTTGDDDFFGFVLGFDPGDTMNAAANFLLIDWKQATQNFNFAGGTADSTGGNALIGLAVSLVTGIPTADELWQHKDLAGNPVGSGVTELARAATLGSTGWVDNQQYEFSFDFGPNNLVIKVDGVEQFNLVGNFSNGRIGFYNFSQDQVRYSAFETEPGTFPSEVPLPASALLLLAGLGGLAIARKRS